MPASLDRGSLAANGITFSHDVAEVKDLAAVLGRQAEIVAEGLLDFHRIDTEVVTAQELLESETHIKLKRKIRTEKIYDKAKHVQGRAKQIVAKLEGRWQKLVIDILFQRLVDRARKTEGQWENAKLAREIRKRVKVESDRPWVASHRVLKATTPEDAPCLPRSKLDLFISLPVISSSNRFKGFIRDDSIRNFHIENLKWMEEHRNVISNPGTSFCKKNKVLDEKDMLCFPCTVIEIKHHEVSDNEVRKCFNQAANGAANALALLNSLTTNIVSMERVEDIYPVVAITFIGSHYRVWIASITSRQIRAEKQVVRYHMQCIWKGNLLKDDRVYELCCIVNNLETWIIEHFEPWVSSCLDTHRRLANLSPAQLRLSQENMREFANSREGEDIESRDDVIEYVREAVDNKNAEDGDEESSDEAEELSWNASEGEAQTEDEDGSEKEGDDDGTYSPSEDESDDSDDSSDDSQIDHGRVDSLLEMLAMDINARLTIDTPRFMRVRKSMGV